MTDDPFWKNPRKIPNVLKLDESMKFSPYQNLISAAIILKKASETLSNGGSNDRVKHFYGWSYLGINPCISRDGCWVKHNYQLTHLPQEWSRSPTSDFRGSEFKVDRCNALPCLNTSCCCLQAFPCWMWTFCKTCSEFQERMAKMQHTRYTVYSIHMITCIVYVGTFIIIIYHCSM